MVENFSELPAILRIAEKYNVRPRIGVRVKLASEGSGKWRDSAGDKSKFGLFITEILEAVEILREKGMLDCLQLVHCHPGSQLQDIRRVKDAINELAHVYAELKLLGAGLQYIDVGGGLGVDYDGSGTNFSSSMNYTLNEYANDVVYRIANVCNTRKIAHPMIVSESGRAIAAHHSVLIFNTLGTSALDQFRVTGKEDQQHGRELPQPVRDLLDAFRTVTERRVVECYHDAQTARDQVLQMFNLGLLSLEQRGLAERLYWATCAKVRDLTRKLDEVPEELEELESILSDIYFCNFSVFQSLPDSWAIDQLFPIMPIHRLNERPTRKGVLADITCDSDGKIDRFVSQRDVKKTLELHAITAQDEYYLARVPGRRLPGNARRPAQPVRRHPRGARALPRRRRLVDRGNRQGRHGKQGAGVHGVRRRRPAPGAGARLRTGGARRPDVGGRVAGHQAVLRRRAQRLRLSRVASAT